MLLEATAYNSLVAVEKVGHGHTDAQSGKCPSLNVVLRDAVA